MCIGEAGNLPSFTPKGLRKNKLYNLTLVC